MQKLSSHAHSEMPGVLVPTDLTHPCVGERSQASDQEILAQFGLAFGSDRPNNQLREAK